MVNPTLCITILAVIVLNPALNVFALQCDPEKEYNVWNKTSGKTVLCLDCISCKPGSELKIPCGSTISIYESVGGCQKCRDGYFSEESSVRPCQKCNNCVDHEIIVGACNCTGRCEEGFVKTTQGLCEKSQERPTKDPALLNEKNGNTGLSTAEIVPIVICAVILLMILIICIVCYKCKQKKSSCKGYGKDEEASSENSEGLLCEKKDKAKTIIQQECENEGLPTSHGPHVLESTSGFVKTSQTDSV